jgi:S-layer family protein
MGIIGTYNDGMFGPNQPITRAEFTELFVKAFLIE